MKHHFLIFLKNKLKPTTEHISSAAPTMRSDYFISPLYRPPPHYLPSTHVLCLAHVFFKPDSSAQPEFEHLNVRAHLAGVGHKKLATTSVWWLEGLEPRWRPRRGESRHRFLLCAHAIASKVLTSARACTGSGVALLALIVCSCTHRPKARSDCLSGSQLTPSQHAAHMPQRQHPWPGTSPRPISRVDTRGWG